MQFLHTTPNYKVDNYYNIYFLLYIQIVYILITYIFLLITRYKYKLW